MSNRLSIHAPEGLEDRAEDISDRDDRVKSDVMRDALDRGLRDMEQDGGLYAMLSVAGIAMTSAGATLVMVSAALPGNFGLNSGALVLLFAALLLTIGHVRPWGEDS